MAPGKPTSEIVAEGPAAPSGPEAIGLTEADAARRLAHFGANALEEARVSALSKLLSYFWGPIPWMIEIAALLSAAVQHWADFAIIVVMLLLNAGVGFWQEFKADSAIAALKQRLALKARVLRDGRWREVPARKLVPKDVVLIRLGNIVPADVRLVGSGYLSVDQSALTGESLPVDKKAGDAAYSGSVAKLGEMGAVVTATGMNTYFGKTARLVQGAGTVSHFQRAVLRIGNFLIFCTIGLVALILVVALFRGDPLVETLLFALILTRRRDPGRASRRPFRHHGGWRGASCAPQGDRIAPRRHRRAGWPRRALRRQDRDAHPEQAHPGRARALRSVQRSRLARSRGARLAARGHRRDRSSDLRCVGFG